MGFVISTLGSLVHPKLATAVEKEGIPAVELPAVHAVRLGDETTTSTRSDDGWPGRKRGAKNNAPISNNGPISQETVKYRGR